MMTVAKRAVPKELLDSLLADYRKPEDLIGENGLLKQLTKLLVEKALEAEMADHLGHGKNEPVENAAGNTRNGKGGVRIFVCEAGRDFSTVLAAEGPSRP
jgi:putative transposase